MWANFKFNVSRIMESPPISYEVLARAIAIEYDNVLKLPPAGDLQSRNTVERGNVELFENIIKSVFLTQQSSILQLDVINAIANGFVAYWSGATLGKLYTPIIPAPGAVANTLIINNQCFNPGIQTSLPFTYEGLDNVGGWIDKLIQAADLHLLSISGATYCSCLYPGGVTGVGLVPWQGFSVNGATIDVNLLNPSGFTSDAAFMERLNKTFRGLANVSELGLKGTEELLKLQQEVSSQQLALSQMGGVSAVGVPITDSPISFVDAAIQIIAHNEGGYFSPPMCEGHPFNTPGNKNYRPFTRKSQFKDVRYYKSGETMFGLDRVAGAPASTSGVAAQSFWAILDNQGAYDNWGWGYIPPDPLKTQLMTLTAQIMEPLFESSFNRHVPAEIRDLARTNGKLFYNFVYAQWNGDGWFRAFGKKIKEVYNKGMKNPNDLAEYFVNMRINNEGLIGNPKGSNAYNLIRQGGFKIAAKLGFSPISDTANWIAYTDTKLKTSTANA